MNEIFYYLLLAVAGVFAGGINTLAGGGSNLTLPILMLMGMPADMANGTNRLGIAMQCLAGSWGFRHYGKLDLSDAKGIVGLTLIGGLVGALTASMLPNLYLKPVLLGTMVCMALVILIRPATIAPPEGTPVIRVKDSVAGKLGLICAGFYGGFVQAGVGFILIAAIAGALHYDLVRTNALKLLTNLGFTLVALTVFLVMGKVVIIPGLILGAGYVVGSLITVRIAIQISQNTLKWFVFLMTLVACGAAMFG